VSQGRCGGRQPAWRSATPRGENEGEGEGEGEARARRGGLTTRPAWSSRATSTTPRTSRSTPSAIHPPPPGTPPAASVGAERAISVPSRFPPPWTGSASLQYHSAYPSVGETPSPSCSSLKLGVAMRRAVGGLLHITGQQGTTAAENSTEGSQSPPTQQRERDTAREGGTYRHVAALYPALTIL
jgi:hypothetical protein